MLKLADLRRTTRRASGEAGSQGERIVYPHLLRNRSLAPRIELAVRYLESMLGKRRQELDSEVVIQLFGDHKIARCIVACLGESYRPRERAFAEVITAEQVAALAERDITTPGDLRLWLYSAANEQASGFVGGAERAPFLGRAGATLSVSIEQIEKLTTLDSPANAILTRIGPQPTADDVIARFNAATVTALLANAVSVRVSLRLALRLPQQQLVRAFCAQAGVRADLDAKSLTLYGQQDALENWSRHGARLARLLAALLLTGLPARSAEARIAAPNGDIWQFKLTAETLGYLTASQENAGATLNGATLLACWRQSDMLLADVAALRKSVEPLRGWRLRRATEPLALAGSALLPLFTCQRGDVRVYLVPPPADPDAAQRLAAIAARIPLLVVETEEADEVQRSQTLWGNDSELRTLRYSGRDALRMLPDLLEQAIAQVTQQAHTQQLEAIFAEAQAQGVVTEQRLAAQLGCEEDEVAARLTDPLAQTERMAHGLSYVEGFGLCAEKTLEQAQVAAQEVAQKWQAQARGNPLMTRTLGRRLREITGASEGIECLIAWLGAA